MKFVLLIFSLCSVNLLQAQCFQTGSTLSPSLTVRNQSRGAMFNIVALNDIQINSFDASLISPATATANYEIYYKIGSFEGSESNSADWTLVGTTASPLQALTSPTLTPIPITVDLIIPAGQTFAFYLTYNTPVSDHSTEYYDLISSSTELLASDTNLEVRGGVGKGYPFGDTFTPRGAVFSVHYSTLDKTLANSWNGSSWSPAAPTTSECAIITGNYDVDTHGDITASYLFIESGANFIMGSGNVSLKNNVISESLLIQTGGNFIFDGTVPQNITIGAASIFRNVEINNSAGVNLLGSTQITGRLTLTQGALNSNGNLILTSTGATAGSTATVDFSGSGSVTGNVTVHRLLDGHIQEGYRYITTNVTGQTLAAIHDDVTLNQLGATFSPGTDDMNYTLAYSPAPNIFYYDQSLVKSGTVSGGSLVGQPLDNAEFGWEIPASTSTALNPGSGAALQLGSTFIILDFTGPLQSNDVVLSLPHGGQTNSGWHLVGNPFAATLDWNAVYDDVGNSGIEPISYVFDASGAYAGNYSGYNASTNAGVNGGTENIASGQAFFIQTTSGMTGNVTLKTSHTSVGDVEFFRTTTGGGDFRWQGELRMKLQDEKGHEDELLIYFIEGAQSGKDLGDAQKVFGGAYGFPQLSSKAPYQNLMMDCRKPLGEEIQTFDLITKSGKAGAYTLTASTIAQFEAGTEIYLEDRQENLLINLKQTPDYSFEINTDEELIENRFQVHLRVNKVTSIEDDLAAHGIALFAHNNQINIQFADFSSAKAQIAVYDLMGRLVTNQSTENKLKTSISIQHRGVYVVRIQNKNGIMAKRIIIN